MNESSALETHERSPRAGAGGRREPVPVGVADHREGGGFTGTARARAQIGPGTGWDDDDRCVAVPDVGSDLRDGEFEARNGDGVADRGVQ
ncbi:hypothetical protein ACFOJ6_05150 [Gordonia humi]|uniref:hypothetical protein n=1 Tax=Gordonia humi TaxID=686429 RepID=UPI003621B3AA